MFLNSLLDGMKLYPFLFDTPFNAVRAVTIWLSLALLITHLVCLFLFKGEKRKRFLLFAGFTWLAYACVIGAVQLLLSFLEDGIELIVFLPLLILLACLATSAALLLWKRTKGMIITLICICGGAFIATMVCLGIHFSSGNAADNNWLTNEDVESLALYVSSLVAVALLLLITWFFGRKESKDFDSKSITYAGICIAMSFALSYLRLIRMPQGGSITPASLLPLMIYAYLFGVRKGVFAGFAYGILQALQDPSILHPAQFLLDYPVAFAWIGIAGIFAKVKKLDKYPQIQFACGATLAGIGRFAMHFLSGAFAFGAFAPEGTPVLLYSLTYQAGYVLPDLAIAVIAGVFLFSSKTFVKELRSVKK